MQDLRIFRLKNLSTIGCIGCFGRFSAAENQALEPADVAPAQHAQVKAQAEEQPQEGRRPPHGAGEAAAAKDREGGAGRGQEGEEAAQPHAADLQDLPQT